MANSTGSYGVSFVDLVDGAVAVVGVVSTEQQPQNRAQLILAHDAYNGVHTERTERAQSAQFGSLSEQLFTGAAGVTVQKPQNKGQCFLAHNVYGGKQAERPQVAQFDRVSKHLVIGAAEGAEGASVPPHSSVVSRLSPSNQTAAHPPQQLVKQRAPG